jgi:hypothetical protein
MAYTLITLATKTETSMIAVEILLAVTRFFYELPRIWIAYTLMLSDINARTLKNHLDTRSSSDMPI